MKIDARFYIAHVETGEDRAIVICTTYNLDNAKLFAGAEFYQFVWSSDRKFTIPSSRAATFQEELRTLSHAAATFGGDRSGEVIFLREKLREAYGNDATVLVEPFTPSEKPGRNAK